MSRQFKEYNPDQMFLLPPSLRDWLPEDHLAYFVSDIVEHLDLSDIMKSYEVGDGRGQPGYHPAMMVKLLFYAYCIGVASSRKIERKSYEDVAFRIISAGYHPDHDTIAEFRNRHLGELSRLFVEVLLLCSKAGLVKLGHVALDGTKVKANASKHKAMSYGRMCEKEKELEREVEELLSMARKADDAEDRLYGKGKKGDELPEELRFKESRLRKIREAKEALENEAKEKFLKEEDPKEGSDVPRAKAQRNFTDPESKIMKDSTSKGFVQGYNAEVAVDRKAQIIVAADVTDEANDKRQVKPMISQLKDNLGKKPKQLSADSGFYSELNIEFLETELIEALVAPGKKRHTEKETAQPRGRIPKSLSIKERMRRKLATKRFGERYKLRKEIVEPVFGQIKEVRGFRAFLLRGLEKVRGEWRLICLTHNLLKLYRSGYVVASG